MELCVKIVGVGSHAAAFGPSAALTVHRTVIHSRFAAKATLDDPLIFAKINFYYFIKNIVFIRKKILKSILCKHFFGSSRAPTPTIFTHNPIVKPQFIGLKGSSLTEELAPKATEEVNICRVFLYKTGKLGGSLHLIRLLHMTASRKIHLPRQGEGLARLLLDGGAGAEGD